MTGWTPQAARTGSPRRSSYDDDSGIGELFDLVGCLHEPWMQRGSCRGSDPAVFFPEIGVSAAAARDVCRGCPVRDLCLNYALVNNLKHGVWGGTSPRQRRRVTGPSPTPRKAA